MTTDLFFPEEDRPLFLPDMGQTVRDFERAKRYTTLSSFELDHTTTKELTESIPEADLEQMRAVKVGKLTMLADEEFMRSVEEGETIDAALSRYVDLQKRLQEEQQSQSAELFADAPYSVDEAKREWDVIQGNVSQRIARIADDFGWNFSTVQSMASQIFLPTQTLNLSEAFGTTLQGIVGGDVEGWRQRFFAAPLQEKEQMLDELEEKAKEAYGSDFIGIVNAMSIPFAVDRDQQIGLDATFDAIDVAGWTSVIAAPAIKMFRVGSNVAKLRRALGDADGAASAAVRDPTGATTPETLATSLHPLSRPSLTPEMIEQIPTALRRTMEEDTRSVTSAMDSLLRWIKADSSGLLEKEFLTAESQARAIRNAEEQLLERAKADEVELIIRDRKVTPDGITIEYEKRGTGEVSSEFVAFRVDDETGLFKTQALNVAQRFYHPVFKFQMDGFVDTATRILNQEARVKNLLVAAHSKAWEPIKANFVSRGKVERVLEHFRDLRGEGVNELMTPTKLRAGVTVGDETIALNDNELRAFYNVRTFMDNMFEITNSIVYDRKLKQGVATLEIDGPIAGLFSESGKRFATQRAATSHLASRLGKRVDELSPEELGMLKKEKGQFKIVWKETAGQRKLEGKLLDTPEAARMSLHRARAKGDDSSNFLGRDEADLRAYNSVTGKIVRLDPRTIHKVYEDGFVLSRLGEFEEFGRGTARFVIMPREGVKPLSTQQLNKIDGYLPIMNLHEMYMVQKNVGGRLDNLRYFRTKVEADAYLKTLEASAKKGERFRVMDRASMSPKEQENEVMLQFGGAFIGERGAADIRVGFDNLLPERLGAYASIEKNVDFISNIMPINAWRMSMQKRWLNTAADISKKLKQPVLANPRDFWSDIVLPAGHPNRNALEEARNYLAEMLRLPTNEERFFKSAFRDLARALEPMNPDLVIRNKPIGDLGRIAKQALAVSPTGQRIRDALLDFSHRDVFSMARAVTFHTSLGFFNTAQLIVQAQNAAIAMSLDPLGAPARLQKTLALRAAYLVPESHPSAMGLYKHVAKASGMDEDVFIDMVTSFQRSGIGDSVFMTADFSAQIHNFGLVASAWRKILAGGELFYREGEMFPRIYSYILAYEKELAKRGGRILDQAGQKAAVDEMNRINMNISRANRAWWQKGLLSIPTQFTKVYWEFLGNMLGKKWTMQEKLRIMAGQVALYGTAGMPFSETLRDGIVGGLNRMGIDTERGDAIHSSISEGFTGFVADFVGAENDFATRLAFAQAWDNFFINIIRTGGEFTSKDFMGAFGSVVGRAKEAVVVATPLVVAPFTDYSLSWEDAEKAIVALASVTATARNITEANKMRRLQKVLDKNGTVIIDNFDPNYVTRVMHRLGFQPADLVQFYKDKTEVLDQRKEVKELRDRLKAEYVRYINRVASGGDVDRELASMMFTRDMLFGMYGYDGNEPFIRDMLAQMQEDFLSRDEYSNLQKEIRGMWLNGISQPAGR